MYRLYLRPLCYNQNFMNTKRLKSVDLFCGCGGMSLGFQNAGFNIAASFDNWLPAIEVYSARSRRSSAWSWQSKCHRCNSWPEAVNDQDRIESLLNRYVDMI